MADKKPLTRSKDLILACLSSREEGLAQVSPTPSVAVVKTAFRWLEKNDCAEHAEVLRSYARDHWNTILNPGRGRAAPTAGETRVYRVQQINDSLFIRLPVSSLSAVRGDFLKAVFGEQTIEVMTYNN